MSLFKMSALKPWAMIVWMLTTSLFAALPYALVWGWIAQAMGEKGGYAEPGFFFEHFGICLAIFGPTTLLVIGVRLFLKGRTLESCRFDLAYQKRMAGGSAGIVAAMLCLVFFVLGLTGGSVSEALFFPGVAALIGGVSYAFSVVASTICFEIFSVSSKLPQDPRYPS